METTNEELVKELNKLAVINNDRTEGYEKAVSETEDNDLKGLFTRFAQQSRKFNTELESEISKIGGKPEKGTTQSGKFYRAWMDIRSMLSGKDKKQILSSCEFGEDVARDTYRDVLGDENIPNQIHSIISTQFVEISQAHDEIRRMRDAA